MKSIQKFPPQAKYIIGTEGCERFSYYGMRSILVIFMTGHLLMSEPEAKSLYHSFVGLSYLLTIVGAFLSDRLFGKYRTILYLSLIYCIGHGVLALFESKTGLIAGLFLIAIGAGGIKACVTAFVGDQFNFKNSSLLEKVFSAFYFSINIGAVTSSLVIPWMLPRFGPSAAFGLPGILMAISTLIFWLGRKSYVNIPPARETGEAGFGKVILSGFRNLSSSESFWKAALKVHSEEEVEAVKTAVRVFILFLPICVFWSLYDQTGSTWVIQGTKLNPEIFGFHIEAAQMQALNPFMVLLLIPFCSQILYPAVEKRGIRLTPLRKISAGMFVTAIAFGSSAILEIYLERGGSISVGWQALPYLLISFAEIFVSVTALEFAYTQASRALKSTVMSFWFLTFFAGNWFTAIVSRLNIFSGSSEFIFYTSFMLVTAILFAFMAKKYPVKNYLES